MTNTTTKHTLGTWEIVLNPEDDEIRTHVFVDIHPELLSDADSDYNDDCRLSFTVADAYGLSNAERVANAHLIAAAPDMLEALELLLNSPDLNFENLEPETLKAMNLAVNAINKAKGF